MSTFVNSAILVSKSSNMSMKLGAILQDSSGKIYKGCNISLSKGVSEHAEMSVLKRCLKDNDVLHLVRRALFSLVEYEKSVEWSKSQSKQKKVGSFQETTTCDIRV
jgi:hypothetical protein